jgi:hypothetical protein
MALPPILSSLPILKLFAADRAQKSAAKTPANAEGAGTPQDIVDLSETVQGIPKTPAEAQQVAVETRTQLSQDMFALGLDPEFAGRK